MNIRRWIALIAFTSLGSVATTAIAQATGGSSRATPGPPASLVPELVTMDQKLAASDQVFVGTGRRIYFVDRSGREVPFDTANRAAPVLDGLQAILEVGIEQELHASAAQRASGVAKFVLATAGTGNGTSQTGNEDLAGKYIGRKAIYFAKRQMTQIAEGGGAQGQAVALPPLLRLVSTPARQGPVDNPLPISELQTVMNAVMTSGHNTEDPNCF